MLQLLGLLFLILLVGILYYFYVHCSMPRCKSVAPETLDVYVDNSVVAGGGNGSKSCPFHNLEQALTKVFECGWQQRATIHLLGNGDYEIISDTRILNTKSLQGDQEHQLVIAGDETTTVVSDMTITAVSTGVAGLAKISVSKTVTNALVQGGLLRLIASGKTYVIGYVDEATNEVHLSELAGNFTGQVGNHVSVGFPSASFTFLDGGVLFSSPSTVLFRNLNFKLRDLGAGINNLTVFGPGLYGFSGVVFKPVSSAVTFAGVAFLNCTAITGTSLITFPGIRDEEAVGCSFLGTLNALDLFIVCLGTKPFQVDNAAFRNCLFQAQSATTNVSFSIMHMSGAFLQQTTTLMTLNNVWNLNSPSTAYTLFDESVIKFQNCDISGASGDGIALDTSHLCDLSNVTTDVANKNTNLGLYIGPISNAKVQVSTVTLTGNVNDLQIGALPGPQTWANPLHSDLAILPGSIFAMYAEY